MFEAAELGRRLSKKEFKAQEPDLRMALLEAQRALREADLSVIVIISGVEGSGRSSVINRLNEWLDPRGVQATAFWEETDEERLRPPQWRFWRRMPPTGRIQLFYGSWYTKPIIARSNDKLDAASFDEELRSIEALERMLTEDRTLIVKFWFHLRKDKQAKRLKKKEQEWAERTPEVKNARIEQARRFHALYDTFVKVATRAIRLTDTGICPWHIVEATNHRYRDFTVGRILLDSLQRRLAEPSVPSRPATVRPDPISSLTVLDQVNLENELEHPTYKKEVKRLQRKLSKQAWVARAKRRSLVILFEGWDAAGKGGAIRRFTAALDARLVRVVPVGAPTDEEQARHYLWRFWRWMPRAGRVTIFDRSWYGRVLVERVERFATEGEWMRAYAEINEFEERLINGTNALVKFWIHISKEEQLRRFKERETVPWKAHKLTEEDWRNREKWDAYKSAVNDMVARTSTTYAPWTLVAGDDKKYSRVHILSTISKAFDRLLDD